MKPVRFDSVIETIHKIDADKSQMKLIILLIVCHRANELNSDGELEYYFLFRFDVNTWKKKRVVYLCQWKKKEKLHTYTKCIDSSSCWEV